MLNRVVLVGRLTKDPEYRTTPSGVSVATFTLAVNRTFTNAQGEREADFINCVVFRKQAENVNNFCLKEVSLALTVAYNHAVTKTKKADVYSSLKWYVIVFNSLSQNHKTNVTRIKTKGINSIATVKDSVDNNKAKIRLIKTIISNQLMIIHLRMRTVLSILAMMIYHSNDNLKRIENHF